MQKLIAFESVSADGYFADKNNDLSWAHGNDDPEFNAFVADNAKAGGGGEGTLVMGRVTYDMMVQYWPTPQAKKDMPDAAKRMNEMPKLVFSITMREASWSNTTLVNGDIESVIRNAKQKAGGGITILGSGSIVSQLTEAGLIDEYQLVIVPVVLGEGRKLFDIHKNLGLELKSSRVFGNGNVFLTYAPKA